MKALNRLNYTIRTRKLSKDKKRRYTDLNTSSSEIDLENIYGQWFEEYTFMNFTVDAGFIGCAIGLEVSIKKDYADKRSTL